jgi:MacB-like periplasmic core domain
MKGDPAVPLFVRACTLFIRLMGRIVPARMRTEWMLEWHAELWHRWQFLLHAGLWDWKEKLRLIYNCSGAFPDAFWHLFSADSVQTRLRTIARSPWTCLTGLALCVMALMGLTAGFPATRELLNAQSQKGLLFIWRHPVPGASDKGLPSDVVPAWRKKSALLKGLAPFNISREVFTAKGTAGQHPLVIRTQSSLFDVLGVRPAGGALSESVVGSDDRTRSRSVNPGYLIIDHATWTGTFRRAADVIGREAKVGRTSYVIAGILPEDVRFLTRRPSVYLVQDQIFDSDVMLIARAAPGTPKQKMDKELTKIAEDACYYFFTDQLRLSYLTEARAVPEVFFAIAIAVSALLSFAVSHAKLKNVFAAWKAGRRRITLRRSAFMAAKLALALLLVFVAGLEWSRSETSILFGAKDPANGPFLVWLYILGAMGVFFWAVADQRARCRECLRLLTFPVRIGCPGCLLLAWSGTELLCAQGHGVLHVPHLSASWDEEADHWIPLDESWRGLFAPTK